MILIVRFVTFINPGFDRTFLTERRVIDYGVVDIVYCRREILYMQSNYFCMYVVRNFKLIELDRKSIFIQRY